MKCQAFAALAAPASLPGCKVYGETFTGRLLPRAVNPLQAQSLRRIGRYAVEPETRRAEGLYRLILNQNSRGVRRSAQGRKSFEGHGENQYNARAKKALKFTMQLLDMMLSDRNLHFFLPDTMRDPDTIALMLTSEATRAQMEAFLARKAENTEGLRMMESFIRYGNVLDSTFLDLFRMVLYQELAAAAQGPDRLAATMNIGAHLKSSLTALFTLTP